MKERIRADSAFLTDLCGRALEVDVEVTSCNRLRAKNTGEPRPLLMLLRDSSKVGGILREARKLHGCTEFSGIFVKKDCTPLERAEKGGEENWIIRHGRVVNVTRKHVEKEVEGVKGAIEMLSERDRVDTKE